MFWSKTHLLPTVLVKPRKHWLCPDMTEKLLTAMLSLNTNKQTNQAVYPIYMAIMCFDLYEVLSEYYIFVNTRAVHKLIFTCDIGFVAPSLKFTLYLI